VQQLEDGSAKVEAEEGGVEEVQRHLKFLGRAWSDCEQRVCPFGTHLAHATSAATPQ